MRAKLSIRDCLIIAVLPLIVACGEKYSGTSAAAKINTLLNQEGNDPGIKAALVRARQLSTSPEILVILCNADAKALGYTGKKLIRSVQQCVEDSGMN